MTSFLKSKTYLTLLALILSASGAFAQLSDQEKAVMKPIEDLFAGMKRADTNLVQNAFVDHVDLLTAYRTKEGESKLHQGKLEEFIKVIAEKSADTPEWIEEISHPQILVDDNMAQVWVDYKFYLGDEFRHCGVNAFQLALIGDEWKIVQLIDTRRNKGCN